MKAHLALRGDTGRTKYDDKVASGYDVGNGIMQLRADGEKIVDLIDLNSRPKNAPSTDIILNVLTSAISWDG